MTAPKQPLMQPLMKLGERLGLMNAGALRFTGWLDPRTELPSALASVAVVVNPSQSETFCISNLQVMSMGIPLISFGIEGMGEYINLESPNSSLSINAHTHNNSGLLFTVLDNSIVANEASPRAITAALTWVFEASNTNPDRNSDRDSGNDDDDSGGGVGRKKHREHREALMKLIANAQNNVRENFTIASQMAKYVSLYRSVARANRRIKSKSK